MERYFKRKSPFSIEENDDVEKSRKDIIRGARVQAGSRTLLSVSIDCVRFLTRQGLVFDDDEFAVSEDRRDFIQLLRCLADQNAEIKAIMRNAPENLVLISRDIQNDIASVAAAETLSVIIEDIGDALFSILLDKSPDVSQEEQMSIVLRYVNNTGDVVERFMGIEHVSSATSLSLKAAIDKLFSRYGLSISRLRGQGYDVASYIQGEFNGLKELILNENPCAFYIHCFAYRLEQALVEVAMNHMETGSLFSLVSRMVNIVGVLSNRCDLLREKQAAIISNAHKNSEISSGQSLNQHSTVNSPHDAHWGSHYGTLTTLITMFSPILDVLEMIVDVESCRDQRFGAKYLLDEMLSFDFVFSLHLMGTILGISNELSKALQRKDEDIVNAISLVKVCKQQLQVMRENGWDSLLEQVCSFCQKHNIDVPNMDGTFIHQGRSSRNVEEMTNLQYFREGLFYDVIDMQLQELNDRFTEVNNELLLCVACLCPNDSFSAFDKEKLVRLAQYYPNDFSTIEYMKLDDQLETYITDMRSSKEFEELWGLSNLSKKLKATKKNEVYPLVYKLVNMALILPVATPTVERVLTAANIVKNRMRNKIGDQWMNDNLVVYIENDVFQKIDDDVIMRGFRSVKTCWEQCFDNALLFVDIVKQRFHDQESIYREFHYFCEGFRREFTEPESVISQVKKLFSDHPDLISQFLNFVPKILQRDKDTAAASAPTTSRNSSDEVGREKTKSCIEFVNWDAETLQNDCKFKSFLEVELKRNQNESTYTEDYLATIKSRLNNKYMKLNKDREMSKIKCARIMKKNHEEINNHMVSVKKASANAKRSSPESTLETEDNKENTYSENEANPRSDPEQIQRVKRVRVKYSKG